MGRRPVGDTARTDLRGVGYWRDPHAQPPGPELSRSLAPEELATLQEAYDYACRLPMPQDVVDPGWEAGRRSEIVAYLKAGHGVASYLGYSFCRLDCGTPEEEMGTKDLSDGTWVWPEGLSHYVEVHAIRLPDEFVETMRENDWCPPKPCCGDDELVYDLDFWTAWGQRTPRRG
jgi:hypothetical protein